MRTCTNVSKKSYSIQQQNLFFIGFWENLICITSPDGMRTRDLGSAIAPRHPLESLDQHTLGMREARVVVGWPKRVNIPDGARERGVGGKGFVDVKKTFPSIEVVIVGGFSEVPKFSLTLYITLQAMFFY
uniref:Uncharacterized protein n=1 Tax=Panagrellus redivivus TaxID=6233 RepID=A0A7E4ZYD1_PANRE